MKPSDWLTLADCLDRKASSEYDLAHTRRLHKLVSSQDPALAQLLLGEKLNDRVDIFIKQFSGSETKVPKYNQYLIVSERGSLKIFVLCC